MPVRSLGTAVLVWPDAATVRKAALRWAEDLRRADESVAAVGYFGSYARGDWGVGSDLDLVVIVADSPLPFERRAARFDATGLPVPADLLVYTRTEWESLATRPRDVVWMTGDDGRVGGGDL
ncbi:MAG: nucleotidyltransferase domain-containing protein [Gemmatimonadales bacterium]|nr:nucleotidyltransferase domain-containing protein [Gemmatimonadales bacterium]